MCGIAGIINLSSAALSPEALVAMTDKIAHRGPDGEGFLITNAPDYCAQLKEQRPGAIVVSKQHHGGVALGHRRLSIVELSTTARHPITEAPETSCIIFQ